MSVIKVATLSDAVLDFWVAVVEKKTALIFAAGAQVGDIVLARAACFVQIDGSEQWQLFNPHESHDLAGAIIFRERISLQPYCAWKFGIPWYATVVGVGRRFKAGEYGRTDREAAMRAWVAYNLGDEVDEVIYAEAG